MKRALEILCIVVLVVSCFARQGRASFQGEVFLSSTVIPQGGAALIGLSACKGKDLEVLWMGRTVLLAPDERSGLCCGFLGVDLSEAPGVYPLLIRGPLPGGTRKIDLEIVGKDYGVRRLTLPKKMVDLDAKTLERVRKESRTMNALWDAPPSPPLWRGEFVMPVSGQIVGPFGRRSIINGQPRSAHSGIDLRGGKGDPIRAINHGKVVLTGDYFFTGRTVVIDHGGGVQSMYFHLDRSTVKDGGSIKKGEILGCVGATGRATGPHLHWGVRVNGARVDPSMLTELSREINELRPGR